MNVNLHFDLLLYGVILVALGMLAHRFALDLGFATMITCIAGGGLAVLWGVLGLRGFRRRVWPIGTLAVLNIALMVLTIKAWLAIKAGTQALQLVAMVLTLLLVFGIGQLVNFMHSEK